MRFSNYGEQLVPFTLMKCIIGHYWKWNFLHLNMKCIIGHYWKWNFLHLNMKCIIGHYWKWNFLHLNMNSFYTNGHIH